MKKITPEEKEQFFLFWQNQCAAIQDRVSEETMYWFNVYTAPTNIGYEFGQLGPGKQGQWDLYHWLTDLEIGCDENEALIASGLTAAEVAEEKRRERYRADGVNPDDSRDVATFELYRAMSPQELKAEITRLEGVLDIRS